MNGELITLNAGSGGIPATIAMFTDSGSLFHLAIGYLAGSVTPKMAIAILAAFIGYQVSQAQAGESWTRTGGEFLEFTLGFLAAMFLPQAQRLPV